MTFASKINGKSVSPEAHRVLATHRSRLRRAERFMVDDEAVRLVCNLCHERDRLPGWAFLARLPYDVCWFEIDLHVKVQEFEKLKTLRHPFDPSTVSPRVGYLMFRESTDSPRWVCHEFTMPFGPDNDPSPGLLAYVFDPEGTEIAPVRGSTAWRSPTLSLRLGYTQTEVQINEHTDNGLTDGYADAAVGGESRAYIRDTPANPASGRYLLDPEELLLGIFDRGEDGRPSSPTWNASRFAVIGEPYWDSTINPQYLNDSLKIEVREQMGVIRWLIAFLAAVNALPRDVRPIVTRPGRRPVGMNMLPYLGHSNLNINLPRDNRVVWARQHIDSVARNSRNRWHQVRGHWMVTERGRSTRNCRHYPTMIESGVGMCERCQLMIRWVDDHSRGDPNIGVVEHTYHITTKKRKTRMI